MPPDLRDAWTALAVDRGLAEPTGTPRREEDDFQSRILELAAATGWRAYHVPDSRRIMGLGAEGFLDLVLCKPPRLVFAELKSRDGRLTADQAAWADALTLCGADVRVWRPADWTEVEVLLTGHSSTSPAPVTR